MLQKAANNVYLNVDRMSYIIWETNVNAFMDIKEEMRPAKE